MFNLGSIKILRLAQKYVCIFLMKLLPIWSMRQVHPVH